MPATTRLRVGRWWQQASQPACGPTGCLVVQHALVCVQLLLCTRTFFHPRSRPLTPCRAPDLPLAKVSFEHATLLLARLLAPLPLPDQGSQALAQLRDKLTQHLMG